MFENIPDAFDTMSRSKYGTDEEFLLAVAAENVRRDTKEFREAYRRAASRLADIRRREAEAEDKRKFEQTKNGVKISDSEMKRMRADALQKATAELNSGRITTDGFDSSVKRHLDAAVEHYKTDAAISQRMNERLRAQMGRR